MLAPSPTSEGLISQSTVRKQSMEMEAELHESDVMWPEAPAADGGGEATAASENEEREVTSSQKTEAAEEGPCLVWIASSSPPVGIPGGGRRIRKEGEDGEAEKEEWEPPHVVASRRWAAAADFSGEGRRRLKGRDLRHVRDAVLRMTGFFEGELSRGSISPIMNYLIN